MMFRHAFFKANQAMGFSRRALFMKLMPKLCFFSIATLTFYNFKEYFQRKICFQAECSALYDPLQVTVLEHKYSVVKYLLSQLRDKDTSTADFRHFSNRIMHLLVEEAIGQDLQVSFQTHLSPTGSAYEHFEMKHRDDEYCGVSILRAGDSMVDPIMKLIPGITIGKILI